MTKHDVPDWYIWSCKKIKYMFPKAHAAAYVMMAWRIAYCKVFYPLAYYAAFFSIRASGFSYELMCQGRGQAGILSGRLQKTAGFALEEGAGHAEGYAHCAGDVRQGLRVRTHRYLPGQREKFPDHRREADAVP